MIVTSANDCLYMDIKTKYSADLDDRENIKAIQKVFSHGDNFYILCNKRNHQLGFHLLIFDTNKPEEKCVQLVGWNHMLDIANAEIQLLKFKESDIEEDVDEDNDEVVEKKVTKEITSLVVSFKMIGINTFNIFVIDLET